MPAGREWTTTVLPGTTLASMLQSGAEPLLSTMPVSQTQFINITGLANYRNSRNFRCQKILVPPKMTKISYMNIIYQ